MDYLLPEWAAKALRKPSERTQMESSLVGLLVMMLGTLGLTIFLITNGVVSGFWYIFLTCAVEFGILNFEFSLLSTTYQTYHSYKMEHGMYPEDYRLKMKLFDAKTIIKELNDLVKSMEEKNVQKKQ